MAYTKTVWEDYPSEDTIIDADKLNNMEDGIEDAHIDLASGWISAGETWTYNSVDSFLISGDYTGIYQVGDKLKLTQTTIKYFRIVAISYSSPNTLITVEAFNLYALVSATITNTYFSKMDTPQGFPTRQITLFSGTPSASVTLSETSANFKYMDVWYEGNNDGGIMGIPYYYTKIDMSLPDITAVAVDFGYMDSQYKIRTSGALITIAGTNAAITGSGKNYSTDTVAGSNNAVFSDEQFIPKITKIIGYRW